MYSPVNMNQVKAKGMRRIRNFRIGASSTKSSMYFSVVLMKMERPPEITIKIGISRNIEK